MSTGETTPADEISLQTEMIMGGVGTGLLQSPGSVATFAERHQADPRQPEVLAAYTTALATFRKDAAEFVGLTVPELHDLQGPLTSIPAETQ